MKRLAHALIAAVALGLVLFPVQAAAMLQLDIGFDPSEACPGDEVHFFFSLENVGDEAETVELSVTLTFQDEEFGPFTGEFELAAGEGISKELAFTIPPMAPAGTLTVTVQATDSDGMVEDSASLEVLECNGIGGQTNPRQLINSFRRVLGRLGVR
jgi:hypothetical protein